MTSNKEEELREELREVEQRVTALEHKLAIAYLVMVVILLLAVAI